MIENSFWGTKAQNIGKRMDSQYANINGELFPYDFCCRADTELDCKGYKSPYDFIGIGKIHSVYGVPQRDGDDYKFYRWSDR
jgi:hypothetical protein